MPNPTVPEAATIEAAYEDQVKTLFKVLVANLIDEPVTHESDQRNSDKFALGLKVAQRAKDLALKVVAASEAAAPEKVASTRRKK